MVKRVGIYCLCCLLLLPLLGAAEPLETLLPFTLKTPAYILMEASTGQSIAENGADERRPVASVNKLMTILLVLESLEEGRASLAEMVVCSPTASGMGGSQVFLDAGASYPLDVLLKATIVSSANDAAVALAERLGGTEARFAVLMNERASAMGLQNAHFVNATGLPAEGQYLSARDIATIAREVAQYPLFFTFSTLWMDTIKHPSGRVTDLTNTNRLVRFMENCDGFKTGSTNEARYCIAATATQGDLRMIAVLLGAPASQTRFDEARTLLEHGLSGYQMFNVFRAGDLFDESIAVDLGSQATVGVAAGEGVQLLLKQGQEKGLHVELALPDRLHAPVEKGQVIGEARVMQAGVLLQTVPVLSSERVGLPGLLESLSRILDAWR